MEISIVKGLVPDEKRRPYQPKLSRLMMISESLALARFSYHVHYDFGILGKFWPIFAYSGLFWPSLLYSGLFWPSWAYLSLFEPP